MKSFLLISLSTISLACSNIASDLDTNKNTSHEIAVGKNPDAMFLTPDHTKLYVANGNDNFVSIIDTKQDKQIGKINELDHPWGFVAIRNTETIALSTYNNKIAIIDFGKDEVVKEKKYNYLFGDITSDDEGKYLYVVAIDIEKVLKLDANTLDSLTSYDTGKNPDGIDLSKDNNRLFVTNRDDGTISIINTLDHSTSLIKTGGKPELINSNKDNSEVYVSNFDLNEMHIIDTETNKIKHSIKKLNGPEGALRIKETNKLYIANYNSSEIFEYADGKYKNPKQKYATGKNPLSVINLGNKLYVTNYSSNSVSVISLK